MHTCLELWAAMNAHYPKDISERNTPTHKEKAPQDRKTDDSSNANETVHVRVETR